MLRVRFALLFGWLVIIASLFYDPFSAALTSPDNIASPFHIHASGPIVQGSPLAAEPYPMTARIFWTMLLPLIPIFLMLFGHEAWRRICPISLVSQIPGMIGLQRRNKKLRPSGKSNKFIPKLVPAKSWIRKNHYYIQFWYLVAGILGRTLFCNSDRMCLAIAFMVIIGSAFTTGIFYGGKSWCQYFCPISVIQATYTGPGGLLDSKAHLTSGAIKQSICRTPSPTGDLSACVGCSANCADTDLEKSYWKSVDSDKKRFMYYGLFGLIIAFYTYYYAYSGNWDYYMSGAWTHESGQMAALMKPGLWLAGHAVAVPKLIAAPLYFLFCIMVSYGGLRLAEALYGAWAARFATPLSKVQLRHRMLTVSGFLSFTLFYMFAGRPNILLMPVWAIKIVELIIAVISVLWLQRSLMRRPDAYRRALMAQSLRDQLQRFAPAPRPVPKPTDPRHQYRIALAQSLRGELARMASLAPDQPRLSPDQPQRVPNKGVAVADPLVTGGQARIDKAPPLRGIDTRHVAGGMKGQ